MNAADHRKTLRGRPPARRRRPWLWLTAGSLGLGLAVLAYVLAAPSSPSGPPGEAPEGMVWVPGGKFWMGSDDPHFADASPIHRVHVDGFWMDRTEVTNAQFARFVQETGYVTVAERKPDPREFPCSSAGAAGARFAGLLPAAAGNARDRRARLVEADPGSVLAPSRGAGQQHRRPRKPSGGSRLLARCGGLCEVGRQTLADRGGMGVRGPRRAGPQTLLLGRRIVDRRQVASQHLAGRVPLREYGKRTASSARRRPPRSRPTATACTTWPAMSGSGAPTGIGRTTTWKVPTGTPRAPIPASILTRGRATSPSASSAAGPSCAAISSARGISPARGKGDPNSALCHLGFRCVRSPR